MSDGARSDVERRAQDRAPGARRPVRRRDVERGPRAGTLRRHLAAEDVLAGQNLGRLFHVKQDVEPLLWNVLPDDAPSAASEQLALLVQRILSAPLNVTAVREAEDIVTR